jgi:hypothetical protein
MKKFLAILALFSVISLAGCDFVSPFVSPIVSGVIYWKQGEAFKYYDFDVDTTYRATKRALRDMELQVTEDNETDSGYKMIADSNDRFKIGVEKAENNISVVRIRVNTFGDKPYAELIYENIDINLGIIEYDQEGKPVKRRQIINQ